MNRKIVVLAVLVVAGGAAFVAFGGARGEHTEPPRPAATSSHGNGIDHSMAAVLALYNAPSAGPPCESAYAAYKTSLDVSTQQNVTAIVLKLAPRDEFLGRCNALPPPAQQCLVPAYKWAHQSECDKAKVPDDALQAMVELRHRAEPGSPPGSDFSPYEPMPMGSR